MDAFLHFTVLLLATLILSASAQQNPSILEDARVHPTSDGSFGFLYRTQDGIAHAAKGDPGGAVHGRFTYTDPTGLKVNFNYNAGAQALKEKAQQPQVRQYQPQPRPQIQQQPQDNLYYEPQQVAQPAQRYTQTRYQDNNSQMQYQQPQYQQPQYQQPQYQQPQYQQPQYQQPQYTPQLAARNEINDYDNQRYRQ